MAVRNQHARTSSNHLLFIKNGIYITLVPKDWQTSKSFLYSIKKRILEEKIQIPSVSEKTGTQPFLVGECSKTIENKVVFYWN